MMTIEDLNPDFEKQLSLAMRDINLLKKQNEVLQTKLDKIIKNNRIQVRALKTIVKIGENGTIGMKLYDVERIVHFTLKKIGEEE